MSITKRNTVICDSCGKFCGYDYDSYVYFGCNNPEAPEPLDPEHICRKCFPQVKAEWKKKFKEGYRQGDWQKSRAEMEAALECGLVYVWSSGVGTLGSKDYASPYQYISKDEYDRLSKLPYWGYCKVCGAERRNGYCSVDTCSESFKSHCNLK